MAWFAQELAKARNSLPTPPPQSPTLRGRFTSLLLQAVRPLLWRLARASSSQDPLAAVYEILVRQMERQLEIEANLKREVAEIRALLAEIGAEAGCRRSQD